MRVGGFRPVFRWNPAPMMEKIAPLASEMLFLTVEEEPSVEELRITPICVTEVTVGMVFPEISHGHKLTEKRLDGSTAHLVGCS